MELLGNFLTFRNRPWKKPKEGSWLKKRTGEGSYSKTGTEEKTGEGSWLKQEPRTEPSLKNWYRLGIHPGPFKLN